MTVVLSRGNVSTKILKAPGSSARNESRWASEANDRSHRERSYAGVLNKIVPPVVTVPPSMLSEAQISQFRRAGHLRIRSVFSPFAIRELAKYCAKLPPSKSLNQIIDGQPGRGFFQRCHGNLLEPGERFPDEIAPLPYYRNGAIRT
jgi:hypothetical protein